MPRIGVTLWDQVVARRMYDAMESFTTIGRAVGTRASQISCFAGRHWPKRDKTGIIRRTPLAEPFQARALRPGEASLPPLPSLSE